MSKPIEIVIADDHSMIREGLKQLLELDGDIKVVGEAKDGDDCLSLLQKVHPDVLLLDINMPNKNGIQVIEQLNYQHMKVKVLILTIHNEIEYLYKAMEMGVNGYVLKDSDSTVLKRAISMVQDGESYVEPALTPMLRERMAKPRRSLRNELLTKREMQVLELLGEGLYNKEIAERLFISEKTVKNHVSSIFKKIGVTDRTQAVVYAIKNNIIDVM